MLEKKRGVIINMCSIASSLAGGGGHAYTSSKHALAGFTKQLAWIMQKLGFRSLASRKGQSKTGMTMTDFGAKVDWLTG